MQQRKEKAGPSVRVASSASRRKKAQSRDATIGMTRWSDGREHAESHKKGKSRFFASLGMTSEIARMREADHDGIPERGSLVDSARGGEKMAVWHINSLRHT